MNQAQRTFLITKIRENVQVKINEIKKEKISPPNLSNYLFHAVMSDKLVLKTNQQILEVVKQKALKAKGGEHWMTNKSSFYGNDETAIEFMASEIFEIPPEFKVLWEEYREKCREVDDKVKTLEAETDTLITRIQLASDKVLEQLIKEVDDMGNITLMNTNIKLLT